MSVSQPALTPSTGSRRRFLNVAGAGVTTSALLTMRDARQAPAQIKGTTLRILQWSHFIPAYDAWFDNKFVKDWGDKNGVKVRVDHIPHLELPARMAAEFAAGAGHDIIMNGSKETRAALRFAKALFDEGMTPEVFSWDDASDNRFLASGVGCWIHDAISAYRTTEDTNPDVFKNTHIAMEPAGPGGKRVSTSAANVYMIWKFSKNQPAAKEFLVHFMEEFKDGMVQSRGYNMPYLLGDAQKPMPIIGSDPKMQILQDFPKIVAFYGYPGPFTTPVQEVVNLFVLPDMFTRVPRGQSVGDVMKWGVGEYQRIFSKHKRA